MSDVVVTVGADFVDVSFVFTPADPVGKLLVWRIEEPFLYWAEMGLVHVTGLRGLKQERWSACGIACVVDLTNNPHPGPATCLDCLAQ